MDYLKGERPLEQRRYGSGISGPQDPHLVVGPESDAWELAFGPFVFHDQLVAALNHDSAMPLSQKRRLMRGFNRDSDTVDVRIAEQRDPQTNLSRFVVLQLTEPQTV